jgi:hypothetical protein
MTSSAERGVEDGAGEQFGVAEGVGDAVPQVSYTFRSTV